LARAFEGAGVRYAIGGSIASSRYGEYRATNDIDVLVEMGPADVGRLLHALGDAFHVDADAARAAVATGRSFSALHLGELVKVDFFVATGEKLDRLQIERRQPVVVERGAPAVYFTSAEDVVLVKLRWFLRSGGVLERQLRDAAGVLKTVGKELDLEYLRHAAGILGLADLLDRALEDAGHRSA
jgi:hypothetical protein